MKKYLTTGLKLCLFMLVLSSCKQQASLQEEIAKTSEMMFAGAGYMSVVSEKEVSEESCFKLDFSYTQRSSKGKSGNALFKEMPFNSKILASDLNLFNNQEDCLDFNKNGLDELFIPSGSPLQFALYMRAPRIEEGLNQKNLPVSVKFLIGDFEFEQAIEVQTLVLKKQVAVKEIKIQSVHYARSYIHNNIDGIKQETFDFRLLEYSTFPLTTSAHINLINAEELIINPILKNGICETKISKEEEDNCVDGEHFTFAGVKNGSLTEEDFEISGAKSCYGGRNLVRRSICGMSSEEFANRLSFLKEKSLQLKNDSHAQVNASEKVCGVYFSVNNANSDFIQGSWSNDPNIIKDKQSCADWIKSEILSKANCAQPTENMDTSIYGVLVDKEKHAYNFSSKLLQNEIVINNQTCLRN